MSLHELTTVADEQIGADCVRRLMSAFPAGVVVVTAVDPAGRPHGMTCSSLVSVTLTPPTLLVCLRTDSRTCHAVVSSAVFVVNLLRDKARAVAELFAAPVADRFDQVRWTPSPLGMRSRSPNTAAPWPA